MSGLQLDPETHTYRYRGEVVPSVTQILKPISPDFSFVPDEKLQRAALLGNAVDSAIGMYEQGILDEESLSPIVREYLDAWIQFKEISGWRTLAVQERVFNERYRYAGTLDLRGLIGDEMSIIDVKRTFALPAHAGPQTAAYANAVRAFSGPRYALHLKPLNTQRRWVLEKLSDPNDWVIFMSCLSIHRFKEKNKC